jgi:hypothetical protein
MRDKIFLFVVVLSGLMLVMAYAQSPARTDSQTGRYQLIATPQDSTFGVRIFRLDTTTGKTWMEGFVIEGGTKKPQWAAMLEPLERK